MKFLQRFFDSSTLWMISPEQLVQLVRRASLDMPSGIDAPVVDVPDDCETEPPYVVTDGVAVIELCGVIVRKASDAECDYFGLCSLENAAQTVTQAQSDPAVSRILLSIDSPGGEACGTPEFAEIVANCQKPIGAWTGGMMASAAYYIGSQANFVNASRSALVGSIGTIMTTYDWTGYLAKLGIKPTVFTDSPLKGAGSPAQSLSEEQRAYLQGIVDEIGAAFRATVRAVRPDVPDSSMQGQIFVGHSAVSAGLADQISTLKDAVFRLKTITQNINDSSSKM